MSPSTATDEGADARCADSYRALYEACRSEQLARRPADQQVSQLARLVSDFALCARAARLRPEVVLSDLRAALEPVARRGAVHVPALVQRAIADYYDAQWH